MLAVSVFNQNITPENIEQLAEDYKAAKVDRVLLTLEETFAEGAAYDQLLEYMKSLVDFFKAKGIETCIWTNVFGYGSRTDPDFFRRFGDSTRITAFDGKTKEAICPLDEKYRAYLIQLFKDIVKKTNVKILLLDDDFVLSVRPGAGCACDKHLAYLSQKLGRTVKREEIAGFFCGPPSKERSLFLQAQGETLQAFCQEIREAIDTISPDIRIGICSSYTVWDIEGGDMLERVRTLAGHTKPLLRLSGAPYWSRIAPRFIGGHSLAATVEFVRMQYAALKNSGVELFDENDPWPRDTRTVPAAMVELYDKMLLPEIGLNRQKYIMHYGRKKAYGDSGYLRAHCENLPYDQPIEQMFQGKTPRGFRIATPLKRLEMAHLPETYIGDKKLMSLFSQTYEGAFAVENCVPTCYEGKDVAIAFGETARHLTEEQIGAGLLLDKSAASILMERGIDIGITSFTPMDTIPEKEYFPAIDVTANFKEKAGNFYKMSLSPQATLLSEFVTPEGRFPATVSTTNATGQRFVIFAVDAESLTYNYLDGRHVPGFLMSRLRTLQMPTLYTFLSGGKSLPVTLPQHPSLYITLSQGADGNLAVLLANGSLDRVSPVELYLDGEYRVLTASGRGQESACGVSSQNGILTLPCGIAAWDFLALELQKIK